MLKIRSTDPANIGPLKSAGAAKLSLYPVKSFAERRAMFSISIIVKGKYFNFNYKPILTLVLGFVCSFIAGFLTVSVLPSSIFL